MFTFDSSGLLAPIGAENGVLEDSRFQAFGYHSFVKDRYQPKDGRLYSYAPWGNLGTATGMVWFKVDLRQIMLVNAIATQGDPWYADNYFPDYKLQFSLAADGKAMFYVKEEMTSTVKV